MNKVASFKNLTVLETDKKINLIYGLNGTGKSTISDYLLKKNDPKFMHCAIDGLSSDDDTLVYNQTFIQENFFESESLKGIFTLSEKNKEVETKIANAGKELKRLEGEKTTKEKELQKANDDIVSKQKTAKNKIWEIKTNYTGGDRVLEFCLKGYSNDGNKLLAFVEGLNKPTSKPTKTIEIIKEDVQGLVGDNVQKYDELNSIIFSAQSVESESLFNKQIVGNENSTASELINKLGNSDWVKDGLSYLPATVDTKDEICPFCQKSTISKQLFESIKDYFDESYETDINSIKTFCKKYKESSLSISDKTIFESNPKYEKHKHDFELKYNSFYKIISDNLKQIEDKIKSPSVAITLKSSINSLEELNGVINIINKLVTEHNEKIDRKETALEELKAMFWEIMRWDYDQTINGFISDKVLSNKNITELNKTIENIKVEIENQKRIIVEQQKQTVNIEEAVANINNGLINLEVTDFRIEKHTENLYKIVRGEDDNNIFRSLSEGEKMIISFLYFIELCKGKKDATEAGKKKIVVIDDPISSLSHIYVFNICRLIHNEIFRNNKYEQFFLLTHSLYFFYEMTDIDHDRRKETQKLFRIRKNATGSAILEMSYEEIQNDYQSYWSVIKDNQQPPALIANCMRNIIEYFFSFVEKRNLSAFIQKKEMQENRFQAFCRYINRESHSFGQNIFDIKEFDYNDFKDAFAELFKLTGYQEHYKRMMK